MFKYCATFLGNTVDEIKLMLGMHGLVSYQYSSIIWYFETENEIKSLKPLRSDQFMGITIGNIDSPEEKP